MVSVLCPFTNYPSQLPSYISALHNLVYTYHEKLVEVTSPKAATMFLGVVADKLVRDLKVTNAEHALDTIRESIGEWGLKLEATKVGRQTICKIECPFAPLVHPLITERNPFCPMSLLVLGAKRLGERDASLASMILVEDGSRFTISPSAALP